MAYTPDEIAQHKLTVCGRIAEGDSLRKVCSEDGMPARSLVHEWLISDTEFADQYTRAREAQADTLFDEIIDIADQYDNLADKLDVEHIQRARLRIDTRKWMAGKLRPKKYGDKTEIAHTIRIEDMLGEL